jgi:hypothetical protein
MRFLKSFLIVFVVLLSSAASTSWAGVSRTQTINLRKGWNAVFLQVTPADAAPSSVFANTPVSIVATYLTASSPVQFVQNPGATPWKKNGWGVWYAATRPDAFLSNLSTVNGNRAYLIYSEQNYILNIQGNVTFEPTRWKSDSFNFIGFCLDEQSPPTFDKFFAGSPAHRPCRVYRLVNDEWTLVANPVQSTMKSGEAYWIYCKGGSDYQGPLMTKLVSGQGVTFSSTGESHLLFVNQSGDPLGVRVESVSNELPLSYVMRGVSESRIEQVAFDLPASYELPVMEPGETSGLWLKLRRAEMTSASQSALLKISTDNGAQVWIPATGTRDDLSATP